MNIQNPMAGASKPEKSSVLSVSKVNGLIRDHIQRESIFNSIWIEGEVLNINYHSSGHVYFSLKDEKSQLKCTFFRNANARFRHIRLENGMQILAKGSISVYLQAGAYQLNVTGVMLAGEGDLRLRIEQLKKNLHTEGLFAPEHKKPLPFYPLTIGVATAATGAAIKDIIRVARNRNSSINILLAPCSVQGAMAAESISTAIEALNDPKFGVDIIIAGRGGGSFEDLMPFNEEKVIRSFFQSKVPIVSAVGHEIDHPITDLVADFYAATPSAAAELVVPEKEFLENKIEDSGIRMKIALRNQHVNAKSKLERILASRVFTQPESMFDNSNQQLDINARQLQLAMKNQLQTFMELSTRVGDKIPLLFQNTFNQHKSKFSIVSERLHNFSPLETLKRGYGVIRDEQKRVIRNANEVKKGEMLEVFLSQGKLDVEVKQINQTDSR